MSEISRTPTPLNGASTPPVDQSSSPLPQQGAGVPIQASKDVQPVRLRDSPEPGSPSSPLAAKTPRAEPSAGWESPDDPAPAKEQQKSDAPEDDDWGLGDDVGNDDGTPSAGSLGRPLPTDNRSLSELSLGPPALGDGDAPAAEPSDRSLSPLPLEPSAQGNRGTPATRFLDLNQKHSAGHGGGHATRSTPSPVSRSSKQLRPNSALVRKPSKPQPADPTVKFLDLAQQVVDDNPVLKGASRDMVLQLIKQAIASAVAGSGSPIKSPSGELHHSMPGTPEFSQPTTPKSSEPTTPKSSQPTTPKTDGKHSTSASFSFSPPSSSSSFSSSSSASSSAGSK
jgi:hypothetical protein